MAAEAALRKVSDQSGELPPPGSAPDVGGREAQFRRVVVACVGGLPALQMVLVFLRNNNNFVTLPCATFECIEMIDSLNCLARYKEPSGQVVSPWVVYEQRGFL